MPLSTIVTDDCKPAPEESLETPIEYNAEPHTGTHDISSSQTSKHVAYTWPQRKKIAIVALTTLLALNTTMSSSLPSGSTSSIASRFHPSARETSLPTACFLVGYIFGPIVFGPLSETTGRRQSLLISFGLYTLFTMACALAPTWPTFLFFRFMVGAGASGPMTIIGGLYADLYQNLRGRGRVITLFNLATHLGPLSGPVLSSHIEIIGWQWPFWAVMILIAILWPGMLWLPETHLPILLKRDQNLSRRVKEGVGVTTGLAAAKQRFKFVLFDVLLRPFLMLREPIVLFTDIYQALIYALFYLYFRAYFIIFNQVYNFSNRETSLTFISLGVGAFAAALVFLWYDSYLMRAQKQGRMWAHNEEYRRLVIVCIGGPIVAATQFWLGWTARPDIHWIVPVLSGVPCGLGMELIMMGLTNYLTDVYGVYSASVLAVCIFTRNTAAVLLLALAVDPFYDSLGVAKACTVLGGIFMGLAAIPFIFIKYGSVWKRKSPFCQKLLADPGPLDGTNGSLA